MFRGCKIGSLDYGMGLKFDRRLGSGVAEKSVKFLNNVVVKQTISRFRNCWFSSLFCFTWKKRNENPRLWSLVKGIYPWPVNSPYNGLVMRKTFPCHGVILEIGPGHHQVKHWPGLTAKPSLLATYLWCYLRGYGPHATAHHSMMLGC